MPILALQSMRPATRATFAYFARAISTSPIMQS
jgi:hypothetical protein